MNANLVGASLVDPLGSHGGPTQTHPLPWYSPALDAAASDCVLTVDQRGFPYTRPFGAHCDIGAYETRQYY